MFKQIASQFLTGDFAISLNGGPWGEFRRDFSFYVRDLEVLQNEYCRDKRLVGANTYDMAISDRGKRAGHFPTESELELPIIKIVAAIETAEDRGDHAG